MPSPPRTLNDPPESAAQKSHIPALDGLRAVAFLIVFLAHAGWDKLIPGGFGVTIFFFLSGFLITTLLRREAARQEISLTAFYIRRARRILPPMYVCLALGYVLVALHWIPTPYPVHVAGGLPVIFYYYNYFNIFHPEVNLPLGMGVFWSLMIEEHFYLLFPPTYKYFLTRKYSPQKIAQYLSIACLLAFLWRFFIPHILNNDHALSWTYQATDSRFDAILWGCVLAIAGNPLYNADPQTNFLDRHKGRLAALGLAVIAFCLTLRNPYFRETARYTLLSVALYPIFFYLIRTRASLAAKLLELKPMREIGQLSYTMYLSHLLILSAVPLYLHAGRALTAIIAFIVAMLFAKLMQLTVENPLRRLIRV